LSEEDPLYFSDRKEWRSWLRNNFDKLDKVWLVYYKKHTSKPTIAYNDAVEEALCYGWIDGKVRRIDEERYMQRYTPRKPKSKWSDSNRKRVEKLIKQKKMTKHGLIHVEAAKKDGRWDLAYSTKKMYPVPEKLEKALKKDKLAWENFNNFSKSNQLMYIAYIMDAKREATKERRIAKVVKRSRNNEKPGMM
jgi:uncharacterized protein YdeI (YjbR/CyaY-like superfamily)